MVNIGSRQHGRLRAGNVIDVGYGRDGILAGIRRAVQPSFRESLKNKANPTCGGNAAETIATQLKSVALDDALVTKAVLTICRLQQTNHELRKRR